MRLRANRITSVLMAIATTTAVNAQAPQILHNWWRTDKDVATVEFDPFHNRVFIGGAFHYVGPPENYFSRIDATTGAPDPAIDHPDDRVLCALDDNAGGWYIGGEFNTVGGQIRQSLAHLDANGQITDWSAAATNDVQVMRREGNTIYMWGNFYTINGVPRDHLAAVDAITGALLPWAPEIDDVNYSVYDLMVRDGTVYLCGTFTDLNGVQRAGLGALDGITGETTGWAPEPTGAVHCLATKGDTVFVGGEFTAINGIQRPYLAALHAVDGTLTAWDPQAVGWVNDILVVGNRLYLMGSFTMLGGQVRSGFGAVDHMNGAPFPWAPAVEEGGMINGCMDYANGLIYAGGSFMKIDGQQRIRLASFDAVTGALTDWAPGANDFISGIHVSGSHVFTTGLFTSTCGKTRNGVCALDLSTGAATDWDARIETQHPVLAIHATSDRIYLGGLFGEVAGEERDHVAAVDAITGVLDTWDPGADNDVWAIKTHESRVFVGGQFTTLGGLPRSGVGAVDINTGLVDAWAPELDFWVKAFAFSGDSVFIGGSFYTVNGTDRERVAALDVNTAVLFGWDADLNLIGSEVRDLELVGNTLYMAGGFNSVGGLPRAGFAAVDKSTALPTDWDPTDTLSTGYGLAMTQGFAHVGGFLNVAGQVGKMVSTDPLSGASQNWIVDPYGAVGDFDAAGNIAIVAGWLNDRIDGEPVEYYAAYAFDLLHTGTAADEQPPRPLPLVYPNPGSGRCRVLGTLDDVSELSVMDMQGRSLRRFPIAREVDLTLLPDAAYLIALLDKDGQVRRR
ncbi:MAG: T9SS type A sorting domain-containing protein, partial [Flavobacteriales bacterium]|nr:T9SS type A sorting domain-containing protein [Flavobacteriales bacterium]